MSRHGPRGFTLLEVLIALVVLAFGMLSLARAIGRASQEQVEAYQRAQAIVLAQEMVDRINNDQRNAVRYVGSYVPYARAEDCTLAATSWDRNGCEWRNRLLGVDVRDGARVIGAPMAARGCIVSLSPNVYVVAVAWQGVLPTDAPDSACGSGEFDSEPNRRVYSTVLQIATLGA